MRPSSRLARTVAAAVLSALLAPALRPAQAERPGSFVVVNGARLWHRVDGRGEPIVLLPGMPAADHREFLPWFNELARSFRVVYFDLLGRGSSQKPADPKEYSLDRDVRDLEGLRRALGFDRWTVLGLGYGGVVAQEYALRHTAAVARLVLVDTFVDAAMWQANNVSCNQAMRDQFPERWEALLKLRLAGVISSAPEHYRTYMVPPGLMFFRDASNAAKIPPDANGTVEIYFRIVGEDADFVVGGDIAKVDFKDRLKDLPMPVLVAAGRWDRISLPRLAVKYKEYIPRAEFVMFEKSGFYPFIEETAEFFKVLRGFLAKR